MPMSILFLLVIGAPASFIFAIAYGMSNGMATITMSILPLVLFSSRGYASLMGKLALPILVTQAISPVLATPIMESWSTRNIFLLAGALSFIALNCLIFLRHFQRHTKQAKDGVRGDS